MADTSELFVRSAKLLELTGLTEKGSNSPPPLENSENRRNFAVPVNSGNRQLGQIQPLVRSLMKTLLEDFPGLLSRSNLHNLMDADYCKRELELELGGLALLRPLEDGKWTERYWAKLYDGQYYVTNNWWKPRHCHNAESLLRFIGKLIDRRRGRPCVAKLEEHRSAFLNYLQKYCQS